MRFWVVAAGTGGHIIPGLALAKKIKTLSPNAEFLFFGSRGRLEEKLIPQSQFPLKLLISARWKGRGIVGKFIGLFFVGLGFLQALKEGLVRRPRLMISVGGYVSVPVGLACVILRIPFILIEPNFKSGIANRLLSRWAKKAFVGIGSDALKNFRCPTEEGVPVREGLHIIKLRSDVQQIAVLGGSQGARSLCQAMLDILVTEKERFRNIKVVLQTGQAHFQWVSEFVVKHQLQTLVEPRSFINDMDVLYRNSDVLITRAGASTVNEILHTAHPTIYVPYPYAADDHQKINAKLLEKMGLCIVVDERAGAFTHELMSAIHDLIFAEDAYLRRKSMHEAALKVQKTNSTESIAQKILAL